MVDVKAALKVGGVEIVALCDVDSDHLAKSAAEVEKLQGKKPATFKLYEDLLKEAHPDAVIIATPPHWHALPFLKALESDLDIYCEKPLAYDVREAQAMVAAARKATRQVVQIGFQRRQDAGFQEARAYIQSGQPGHIVQVEAQIHYQAGLADPTPQDPPASLDWDLWCGPGPKIPYSPQVGHMNWRLEKTVGQGHLVDWGIHLIDAIRVTLQAGMPRTVQTAGGLYEYAHKITTPDVLMAHFEFETCPVSWRHKIWARRNSRPRSTTASSSMARRRPSSSPTTSGSSSRAASPRRERSTPPRATPARRTWPSSSTRCACASNRAARLRTPSRARPPSSWP